MTTKTFMLILIGLSLVCLGIVLVATAAPEEGIRTISVGDTVSIGEVVNLDSVLADAKNLSPL